MNEHPDNLTLMAYRDGELAGEAHADVARHVEGCAGCRGQLAEMGGVSKLFEGARAGGMRAPSGLAGRIKSAARERNGLDSEVVAEVETIKIARWLTWAAAAVIAVSCAGLWLQGTQTTMQTTAWSGPVRFDPATVLMVSEASAPGNEDRQFAQWMVADLSGRLSLNQERGAQ
jgi:predicted anti-sigma-YlaC factor YlaD